MKSGDTRRLFVKYHFYRVMPEWRRQPADVKTRDKRDLSEVVSFFGERTTLQTYCLVGLRGDADFMIRQLDPDLESISAFASAVRGTTLGGYLETPYSYLAVTKQSPYVADHRHPGQESAGDPSDHPLARYLIVYPFVKSREWYSLPFEKRRDMMKQHIEVGHRYPQIKIHTSYSFGLDDQEFVVAFDTDDVMGFLDLVMELRETSASAYTLRDTPAFTCIARPIAETLDSLDGALGLERLEALVR